MIRHWDDCTRTVGECSKLHRVRIRNKTRLGISDFRNLRNFLMRMVNDRSIDETM